MQKYSINYYYRYSKDLIKDQFLFALDNLDFQPVIMHIAYGTDEIDSIDTDYNYNKLIDLIDTHPVVIQVSNMEYDIDNPDDYKILKIHTNELYDTFEIVWSKTDVNKLQNTSFIEQYIHKKEFICGYCYNSSDGFDQLFKYRELEDSGNPIADINLYGRIFPVAGIMFVAAPITLFGIPICEIIERSAIQDNFNSILSIKNDIEIFTINLFDIYSLPSLNENRIKQKQIWNTFKIESCFKRYSEIKEAEVNAKLGITPDMDLIERLNILTGKKKRKS